MWHGQKKFFYFFKAAGTWKHTYKGLYPLHEEEAHSLRLPQGAQEYRKSKGEIFKRI